MSMLRSAVAPSISLVNLSVVPRNHNVKCRHENSMPTGLTLSGTGPKPSRGVETGPATFCHCQIHRRGPLHLVTVGSVVVLQ